MLTVTPDADGHPLFRFLPTPSHAEGSISLHQPAWSVFKKPNKYGVFNNPWLIRVLPLEPILKSLKFNGATPREAGINPKISGKVPGKRDRFRPICHC